MQPFHMALAHPIDRELRARLKALDLNQKEFAAQIGREASWFNKYINGQGAATVDDVVRILAVLAGVTIPQLSALERKMIQDLRQVPPERQEDVAATVAVFARRLRRAPSPRSDAPAAHNPPVTVRKARDKR